MARRRFKKVYVEITSVCNLRCPFCPPTNRSAEFLNPERFAIIVDQVRSLTNLIYLHVKGEPFLHPHLDLLLDRAAAADLQVDLVTNGTLINRVGPIFNHPALRKLSVSLHSFSGGSTDVAGYLSPILWAVERISEVGKTAVLRFWRDPNSLLTEAIDRQWPEGLPPQVFIHQEPEFDWPRLSAPVRGTRGFCLGLRDHIAILVDGTVVPCCLDGEGVIALGNVFQQSLQDILEAPRARAMYNGFSQERCVEPLCQRCGFRGR